MIECQAFALEEAMVKTKKLSDQIRNSPAKMKNHKFKKSSPSKQRIPRSLTPVLQHSGSQANIMQDEYTGGEMMYLGINKQGSKIGGGVKNAFG